MKKVFLPGDYSTIFDLFLRCQSPDLAFWKSDDFYYLAPLPAKKHVLWENGNVARIKHITKLNRIRESRKMFTLNNNKSPNHFVSGLYGFFSYDFGRDRLNISGRSNQQVPLSAWNEYDFVLSQQQGFTDSIWLNWNSGSEPVGVPELFSKQTVTQSCIREKLMFRRMFNHEQWCQGFEETKKAIRMGEIYQLNLTELFSADFRENERQFFLDILQKNPAEYAAFFGGDTYAILSMSPELFLRISSGKISTRPIKGTSARGENPEEDRNLRTRLMSSPKEKAELFMITDLMRNDLAQHCQSGTVKVVNQRKTQALPSVWHTYAEIIGQLKEGVDELDAMIDCLPCGSISGCPKKRAVETIEMLEPHSRGIFCGTMGSMEDTGEINLSVLIRTFLHVQGQLLFQAGGGITHHSILPAEEQEIAAKYASFFVLDDSEIRPPV